MSTGSRRASPNSTRGGRGSSSSKSTRPSTKTGKTSVVSLDCSDDDSYNEIVEARSVKLVSHWSSVPMDWNIDSGCSLTMNPHADMLTDSKLISKSIQLADSSTIKATHGGLVSLPLSDSLHHHSSFLVPDLQEPLLSVSSMCDDGFVVIFDKLSCSFFKANDVQVEASPVGRGYRQGNLYYLSSKVSSHSTSIAASTTANNSLLDWH